MLAKFVSRALAATAAILMLTTVAWSRPVVRSAPAALSQAHAQLAAQARRHEEVVGQSQFRANPSLASQKWNSVYSRVPVGNMTASGLRDLLAGRYMIDQERGSRRVQVFYFGQDAVHVCQSDRNRVSVERYYITPTVIGTGLAIQEEPFRADRFVGQAVIYDASTGQIRRGVGGRRDFYGWVQAEYPAFAAQVCPGLPRTAQVNADQTSHRNFQALANAARPVRGAPTVFQGVTQNPLNAAMYVYLYPYE
jgi:hypothetical protein